MAAFVNAVDGGFTGAGTSLTFAFDCTGADILWVGIVGDLVIGGADDITGVTYNGVAMTAATKYVGPNAQRMTYLRYLVAPASGSHNVVVSCTSAHLLAAGAMCHSGSGQTGQPDNVGTNNSTLAAAGLTTSITPVADNCWSVLMESGDGNANPAQSTGDVRRSFAAATGLWGLFDSNGPITPPGAYSMATTRAANTSYITHLVATFSPPSTTRTGRLTMLGVG